MKKLVFMSVMTVPLIMSACGSGDSEDGGEKGSACKTGNGIAIDCEDAGNYKKIGELNKNFELTFPKTIEDYKAFIETNEAVLNEIDPLWQSMEDIVKADPGIKEQQHYTRTMKYKADVEKYKAALEDITTINITGAYSDSAVVLTIKSGSSRAISEIRGHMTYMDAEGDVLCEKDYEITAEDLNASNGIPAGFEGTTVKGIYCKDAEKVSSVKFEPTGLDYFEEE